MGSIFDIPKSYSGLLDDVVYRHRITPDVDATFFSRSILRNVFFSGEIFLNDGYLVNHPDALKQLMTEDSLLRVMVKNGFVHVLARFEDPDSFSRTPESMAERGVATFAQLTRSAEWPTIRKGLYEWSEALFVNKRIEFWPNIQMNIGFRKLFGRVLEKKPDNIGLPTVSQHVFDNFRRRYELDASSTNAPRTSIEKAAEDMFAEKLITLGEKRSLMDIANQCYHYNFAMCLSASRGESVIADTTIGMAFDEILELEHTIDVNLADMPVIAIPKNFPIHNGRIFDRILDPQSKIYRAKHEFLQAIDSIFVKSEKTDESENNLVDGGEKIRQLEASVQMYRAYLSEHFSELLGFSDIAYRRGAMITFGFGAAGSAVGADLPMLAANIIMGGERISSFMHKVSKPLMQRIMNVALNPEAGGEKAAVFRFGEIKPRFASLAFNKTAVANHVGDLPPQRIQA